MENITGKIYGSIKVLEDTGSRKVYCECLLCGNKKMMDRGNIKKRPNGGCGCRLKESARANAYKLSEKRDITGKTFGDVKVIKWTGQKKGTQKVFLCKCLRCGKEFETVGANITRGATKSCGCLKQEQATKTINEDSIYGTKLSALNAERIKKNNTSGVTGVCLNKGSWMAYINFQGKRYQLYRGKDKDIAIQKRKNAEKNIRGDFLEWLKANEPELYRKYLQ